MPRLNQQLIPSLDGRCNSKSIVQGKTYRFTVLTSRMLRMEYSEEGRFEDRPTQIVWNRDFPDVPFTVIDTDDRLEIDTAHFHMFYNKKSFSEHSLYIDVKYAYTNYGGRWRFGQTEYGNPPREHNLKGTARTLDRINGPTPLEFGLLDTSGRAFFDDSGSLALEPDGQALPRSAGTVDYYYFGYGHDYLGAIRDFYKLSGSVPMLPRYALGNWWSRYYPYSEESYKALLMRFEAEDLPFTVAVMDMDWHLVDIPEKYGRGWTGYTWNKELFPDPEGFLHWVKERGYKVTLNLHPADGVKAHEDMYPEIAKALGVNTEQETPILFNISDPAFVNAYFDYLHHPIEKMGVDFWWIDWQQGKSSEVEGLDPLWMLNHYHYLDICRGENRGLILSRYGGLGSHRYPVGFSGDIVSTWESLDFQPYFTATASNVGYSWWSHDIGGHMLGIRDGELMIRWMQFGIFSPIHRLHSNNNPFCGKEPWSYDRETGRLMGDILRLRHRMIPYLHTMNRRCHNDLVPLITPVYYHYPDHDNAYLYRNQYFFGSELLVCPITTPKDQTTGMGSTATWIPPGLWTDMMTGYVYQGGKQAVLCRDLAHYPVLAKAGGIVPLSQSMGNRTDNPERLEILVFPGGPGHFTLFEDSPDGRAFAETRFDFTWQGGARLRVTPAGDLSVLPPERGYTITFRGVLDTEEINASHPLEKRYDQDTRSLSLVFPTLPAGESIELSAGLSVWDNHDRIERIFAFLHSAKLEIAQKTALYKVYESAEDTTAIIASLSAMDLDKPLFDALLERTL